MSREIPLTRGLVAIVDDDDFEWLSQWKWYALRSSTREEKYYACRNERVGNRKSKTIFMHREIMAPAPDLDVDHRDRNGLNNQRANLRCVGRHLNIRAKRSAPGVSGYRGVKRSGGGKPWVAVVNFRILPDGRVPRKQIGTFDDPAEAARAWDAANFELFGEFAVLNFPRDVA